MNRFCLGLAFVVVLAVFAADKNPVTEPTATPAEEPELQVDKKVLGYSAGYELARHHSVRWRIEKGHVDEQAILEGFRDFASAASPKHDQRERVEAIQECHRQLKGSRSEVDDFLDRMKTSSERRSSGT